MKKILILYATAGIGHKKAALAVKAALDELSPKGVEVVIADALDYANKSFKSSYLGLYLFMVTHTPTLWGFSYYFTDNPIVNMFVSRLRRLNNWTNSGKLREYLITEKFDVIISTHFFATEVISDMKSKGMINSHLMTVVTDYRLHSWWVEPNTDTYVVGGEDAKKDLLRWGVNAERIKVLGIPIEPVFTKKLDPKAILKKAFLRDDLITILVIGGGFGVGPIEEIVRAIDLLSKEVQMIVICGHNKELYNKLLEMKSRMRMNMALFGFVDNVYEYMEIADLLISKSGGITTSEAMAKDLPMAVISPIIGQETRNSDFIVGHGGAVKVDKVTMLKDELEKLVRHPENLIKMREAISLVKKPRSSYDVATLAIEIANKR